MSSVEAERTWIVVLVLVGAVIAVGIYARFQFIYSLFSIYQILQALFN